MKKDQLFLPVLPYKGIKAFRYADRNIFSERDEEKDQLYDLINVYKGCLLYGQSGTGKSSLVAAGLVPLLETYYQPEIIRVSPSRNGTFIINKILIFEKTYKRSFFDNGKNETESKISVSFNEFLSKISSQVRRKKTLVLIFDQFEELITQFEEAGKSDLKEDQNKPIDLLNSADKISLQKEIVKLLQQIYYNSALRVKMVFVFREDYLAKFTRLFDAIPDLNSYFVRITAIHTDSLRAVIEYPFLRDKQSKYDNPFSKSTITTIHDKLLEYFNEDDIALTDVQIVCYSLYENSEVERKAILSKPDAVKYIIEKFYLDILKKFDENERKIAISILSILVLNERTRNIFHEDLIIKEFTATNPGQERVCLYVLNKLESQAGIVRKEKRKGGYFYEITSEAIIPYINQLKVDKKTEDAIKEKEEEARIERKKRRRGLMYIFGICSLIIIVVCLFLYQQQQIAKQKLQGYIAQQHIAQQKLKDSIAQQKLKGSIAQQKLKDSIAQQKLKAKIGQQLIAQQQLRDAAAQQQLHAKIAQQQLNTKIAQQQLQEAISQQKLSQQKRAQQQKVDSVNALNAARAFADTSESAENYSTKQIFAVLSYNALPQSLKDNDTFIPQVYTVLSAIHVNRFRNATFYAKKRRSGYKNVNSIVNIGSNLYFNRPFVGLMDISGNNLFRNPALLKSWLNQSGTILASVIINKDQSKQLIFRNINNTNPRQTSDINLKNIPLSLNQDVLSLIFDPRNNTCIYATRFPGEVYSLNLTTWAVSVLTERLQSNEYTFLANRGSYFAGITNLGNYTVWSNYSSLEPQSIKPRITTGNVVTAIACGDLNRNTLYAGCENGDIYKIDAANNIRKFYSPTNTSAAITCLASSADGRWLAAGYFDGTIKLWKLDAKEQGGPADINLAGPAGSNKNTGQGDEDSNPPDGVSAIAFTMRGNILTLVTSTNYGYIFNFPLSIHALFNDR